VAACSASLTKAKSDVPLVFYPSHLRLETWGCIAQLFRLGLKHLSNCGHETYRSVTGSIRWRFIRRTIAPRALAVRSSELASAYL
jgi:hypothetical protein